ncbi:hypothetical protein [Flammeovirga aprica]|uniref:Uncharacterized protein n=1 Tax=Flammeovirga aprica JL-4 TaxID=694437 RepID=A0A7X9XBT3_9BACT|nr:hypothetical protein [Flammeovirga aprica]NME71008.1 hypothetical protein [Flammeovirga aprica JL-4]
MIYGIINFLPSHFLLKKFCILLLIFLYGCKQDQDITACGCESNTTSDELISYEGVIFYKNDINGNNFNNNKYWLIVAEENCGNCVHHLIVCNDDMVSSIKNIPVIDNYSFSNVYGMYRKDDQQVEGAVNVLFTGSLKQICNPIFAPADYTYNNIVLTEIKIK